MARELRRVLDTAPAEKLGFLVVGAEVSGETQEYEAYYGAPVKKPDRRKPDRRRPLRDLA